MPESELILLAYGLIALGLLLLVAELFLPSGVLLVLSLLALSVGLVLLFITLGKRIPARVKPGAEPEPAATDDAVAPAAS